MTGRRYTGIELAATTNVRTRTIREWVRDGILPHANGHGNGKHRFYTEAHVQRIRAILDLKDGNMTHADLFDRFHPTEDDDDDDPAPE